MSGFSSSILPALTNSPTAIVNGFSSGSPNGVVMAANGCLETLSGALTANTLATILNLSTGGVIERLALYTKDATARTLRLQVTIDGVIVFDSTSASISTSAMGIIAIGVVVLSETTGSVYAFYPGAPVPYNSSCVVKIASSLSETDKIALLSSYRTC